MVSFLLDGSTVAYHEEKPRLSCKTSTVEMVPFLSEQAKATEESSPSLLCKCTNVIPVYLLISSPWQSISLYQQLAFYASVHLHALKIAC